MASYVDKLKSLNLITPPKWLPSNVLFEGMTGSISYAVSNDSSDMDIVGFCMPKKENLFPSMYGYIEGFGEKLTPFNQFQQHHINYNDKSIDMTIYSISRFFQLCMDNNPNMIDALFLPRRCVLFSTEIYEHVRDNRHIFLHKGCWHKFRGYAYSQLHKIENIPKELIELKQFENSVGIESSVSISNVIKELSIRGIQIDQGIHQ